MSTTQPEPVIDVHGLQAFYGRRRILHGIDHGLGCGRNGREAVGLQRAAIAKVEIVVHREGSPSRLMARRVLTPSPSRSHRERAPTIFRPPP